MSNYRFTVLVSAALIAVITVSNFAFAQQSLGQPLPAIGQFTDSPAKPDTAKFKIAYTGGIFTAPSGFNGCDSNQIQALTHSTIFRSSVWDTSFAMSYDRAMQQASGYSAASGTGINEYIDINGDGLPDYVRNYAYDYNGNAYGVSCLYLNTGSGFAATDRCFYNINYNTSTGAITSQDYYGDCAG